MNTNKSMEVLKKNIRREPWLATASILVMVLTFLTLNIFMFSVLGTNVILNYLENRAQVNIYFLDSAGEQKILDIKSNLEKDSRISAIKYVSKAEALKRFTALNKDEPALLESVTSNPLPASLEVKANKITDLQKLSTEFEQIEGVDKVKFYKDVVDTFRKWSNILRVGSFALLFVLALVSIVMVFITIGITINSKGVEIEILKLVGASDKYVKNPLVLQGVFYGVVAAIVSTLLLFVLVPLLSPLINSVLRGIPSGNSWVTILFWDPLFGQAPTILHRFAALLFILLVEVIFGTLLGYIASTAAIKKYLKY